MKYNCFLKATALILICVFLTIIVSGCSGEKVNIDVDITDNVAVNSLSVMKIFPYSGAYVEDGTDDEVKDVVAAVLANTTSTDYEYVEFSVMTDKGIHNFTASTVKAFSTMTVLCKNKDKFEKNESMQSFSIDVEAEYAVPVSLAEGILDIYYTDKTISLKNSSDRDLNNISVFYKQRNDMGYFGGITYKMTVPSLKAGEITQLNSDHLDEIVNITYYE